MPLWEVTHGKVRGGYLKAGTAELYVREAAGRGGLTGGWLLYVDGRLEGTAEGEAIARAAAELAVRCMVEAGTSGEAAAA
jgi:hypothetical protein